MTNKLTPEVLDELTDDYNRLRQHIFGTVELYPDETELAKHTLAKAFSYVRNNIRRDVTHQYAGHLLGLADALPDLIKAARKAEEYRQQKNDAYKERNALVCALSKLFPACLSRHSEEDKTWDREWIWIVYIDLPTGQVSWHIHDSDYNNFSHLEVKETKWDGHTTEEKYQRLESLKSQLNEVKQLERLLFKASNAYGEAQMKAEKYREALQWVVDHQYTYSDSDGNRRYLIPFGGRWDNSKTEQKRKKKEKEIFELLGIKDGQPYEQKGE